MISTTLINGSHCTLSLIMCVLLTHPYILSVLSDKLNYVCNRFESVEQPMVYSPVTF